MRSRIIITAVVALTASLEAGSLKLGKRYKDETNGFQITTPSKWDQVPTKFQEVAIVGKWSAPRTKGYYQSSLLVLRFLKNKIEDAANPMEALKRGIPGYGSILRFQPKDLWEYIDRNFIVGSKDVKEDVAEFRMSSKKYRAHYRVYMRGRGGDSREARMGRAVVVGAQIDTVEESDSSFGVIFTMSELDFEDWERGVQTIIKRFRILDPDEEEEENGEEGSTDADIFVDSTKKPEAWRDARKKKLIKGWGAVDTENYLIVYNKEVKKPLLKKVAKHIEAIRKQVYEPMFPPTREIKAISVVRVCKDRAEYHKYGGPGGSAGYWSRGDEELVFYQDKSNKKDSLRVLYHEAFHQYIHYAVGDVAPHSWFNEGHGDYYAGHNYSRGKFKADVFRWRTGIIANAIAQKRYVPLRDFLKYTQGQYYANPGLCYAQGWSFVYFLREVERRKIKKYKQYWGLLDRYFEAIKRNVKDVKDKGLEGLELPEPKPEEPKPEEKAEPTLPRPPGLEKPFPGEHPLAGAGGDEERSDRRSGETKTSAGPKIRGVRSGLDAAVEEVFFDKRRVDLEQLEKDWITFSKRG
ncbi:MAG: hypothetical protein ACYTHK_12975 [Planctomycetota bacterium]|jgi:hypothetical protein